ncbi:MAG TPA: WG repeat-containing protein, partial [Chitinophagaceae bacterium]|nr:WG repeat-containing protein [Chitinophagaceae bacterium]
VMDGAGNMVVPYGKYDNIENFAEGFACVGVETGASPDKDEPGISTVHQKIGYIDVTGKEVIPLQFEDIMPSFSEGFVQAMQHEKIGYIDRTGKWVIQPRFDKAQPFSHGFAKVIAGGSSYYIDTKGNKIQ